MKKQLRKLFTKQQLLYWQFLKRFLKDYVKGDYAKMERIYRLTPAECKATFPYVFSTEQRITPSPTISQKLTNLRLAADKIAYVCIPPNAIFSFWKCVGEPTEKQGFMQSRSLLSGKIQDEIGGGLCQLSGILHYLLLETGFDSLERHSHSMDIYKEEERFAPLGTDATVSYLYKDFRFKNTTSSPLFFSFLITDNRLQASLHSQTPLVTQHLAYNREERPPYRKVSVYRNGTLTLVSSYLIHY